MDDNIVLKLLNLLEELSEKRGVPKQTQLVDKNINPVDDSTLDSGKPKKPKPALSANEKSKLIATFSLFNKMFFEYKKKTDEESQTSTLASGISKTQKKSSEKTDICPGIGGLMLGILGGLGLFAASVISLGAAMSGVFGDMTGAVVVVGKLGFMGALGIIGKFFSKRLAMGILKKLPIIGGIISLGLAVRAFKEDKPYLGLAELISGLLNFIPVAGPFLSFGADILIAMAESQGMFNEGGALSKENGWNTIKGWASSMGKVIWDNGLYIPVIGTFKRFGMASDAFKAGQFGEGIKQIGLGIFTLGGGGLLLKGIDVLSGFLNSEKSPEPTITKDSSWGERLMAWIRSKLKDLPWYIKKPLAWFGIISDDQVGEPKEGAWASISNGAKSAFESTKQFISSAWDKMKGPLGDSIATIKTFAGDFWEETEKVTSAAWESITVGAAKVWGGMKDTSEKVWGSLSTIGNTVFDGIASMSDKTKDMVVKWIPGVVEVISGIAGGAMDVLKKIASTIGGWIGDLISPNDKKNIAVTKEKEKAISIQSNSDMVKMLSYNGDQERNWFSLLHDATIEQSKLLLNLITLGSASLNELKKIAGSPPGGNPILVNPTIPSLSTPPTKETVPDNRDAYISSPYALA